MANIQEVEITQQAYKRIMELYPPKWTGEVWKNCAQYFTLMDNNLVYYACWHSFEDLTPTMIGKHYYATITQTAKRHLAKGWNTPWAKDEPIKFLAK